MPHREEVDWVEHKMSSGLFAQIRLKITVNNSRFCFQDRHLTLAEPRPAKETCPCVKQKLEIPSATCCGRPPVLLCPAEGAQPPTPCAVGLGRRCSPNQNQNLGQHADTCCPRLLRALCSVLPLTMRGSELPDLRHTSVGASGQRGPRGGCSLRSVLIS